MQMLLCYSTLTKNKNNCSNLLEGGSSNEFRAQNENETLWMDKKRKKISKKPFIDKCFFRYNGFLSQNNRQIESNQIVVSVWSQSHTQAFGHQFLFTEYYLHAHCVFIFIKFPLYLSLNRCVNVISLYVSLYILIYRSILQEDACFTYSTNTICSRLYNNWRNYICL